MKKIFLLLVAVFMTGQIFAQEIKNAEDKNAGNAAYKAKNYALAYAKWDAYLKANNFSDQACCYNAAVAAFKSKKYSEAITYYEKSVANKYKVASSYIGKAKALKAKGDKAGYLAVLQEAMKAVPNNATLEQMFAIYYLQLGQAAQKAGDLAKAEMNYNKVVQMSNRGFKSQGLTMMGQMFFNQGAMLQEKANAVSTDKEKFAAGKIAAIAAYKKALEYGMQAKSALTTNTDASALVKQINDAIANISK